MANRKGSLGYPPNALEQAKEVRKGWEEIGEKLTVPNLSLEEFIKKVEEAQEKVRLAKKLREERRRVVASRNQILKEVWDLTKRVRNAAKAAFGDDSPEVRKMGITPSRARRKRRGSETKP